MQPKLDRTIGIAQSHAESGRRRVYWLSRPESERLEALFLINSMVYGYDLDNPPKMDRTAFSSRKHSL